MKTTLLPLFLFLCFTSEAQLKVKFNKKTNNLTFYNGSRAIFTDIEKYTHVDDEPQFSLEPPPEEVIMSNKRFAFDLIEKSKKLSFNFRSNYLQNPKCHLRETRGIVFTGDNRGIVKKDTTLNNGMFFTMKSYFNKERQRSFYNLGFVSVKEVFELQPKYLDIRVYRLNDTYVTTMEINPINKSAICNLYRLKDKKLLIKDAYSIDITKYGKSYIFTVSKDGIYTILDEKFNTIIPSSKYVNFQGEDLSEGCYKPKIFVTSLLGDTTKNVGIYNNSGKLLMKDIIFKDRVFNRVTEQDYFCIQKNGKYGLINSEGELLVPFNSEIELNIPYINYPEVPILIKEKNKFGYINSKFIDKTVTPIIYEEAKPFYDINGLPEADVSLNGKWGILNPLGEYIISLNSLEPVSSLDFKKYVIKKDDGYYLLEKKLTEEKILLGPFDSFKMISENYLFIVVNNKKRIVNFADYKISTELFDDIKASRENIIVVKNSQEMIFDTEKMKTK